MSDERKRACVDSDDADAHSLELVRGERDWVYERGHVLMKVTVIYECSLCKRRFARAEQRGLSSPRPTRR